MSTSDLDGSTSRSMLSRPTKILAMQCWGSEEVRKDPCNNYVIEREDKKELLDKKTNHIVKDGRQWFTYRTVQCRTGREGGSVGGE